MVEAAKRAQKAPLDLLLAAGAIDSPYQFHWKRFLLEHFPKGTGFAPMSAPPVADKLETAAVRAFSLATGVRRAGDHRVAFATGDRKLKKLFEMADRSRRRRGGARVRADLRPVPGWMGSLYRHTCDAGCHGRSDLLPLLHPVLLV